MAYQTGSKVGRVVEKRQRCGRKEIQDCEHPTDFQVCSCHNDRDFSDARRAIPAVMYPFRISSVLSPPKNPDFIPCARRKFLVNSRGECATASIRFPVFSDIPLKSKVYICGTHFSYKVALGIVFETSFGLSATSIKNR